METMVCFMIIAILVAFVELTQCLPIKENGVLDVEYNSVDEDNIDLSHFGNALFGEPDTDVTGKAVAGLTAESNINPEELGSYLEGDILMPRLKSRNGLISLSSRWPNGIVPFEIRGNFSAREIALIKEAITEFHNKTCIKFVARTSQIDYVSIVGSNSGCWSSVGRIGGKQEVNLQSTGCLMKRGTAMHELTHAIGFLHEQNRSERDTYVEIHYENIQTSAVSNFYKASADKVTAFGVPYDYGSVMHYSANAFSVNGNPTIVAKQTISNLVMGQRDGFSAYDVRKLNAMYNCAKL